MSTDLARRALTTLAKRPAVLTIDLHRGHLDMDVATLPLTPEASAGLMERAVPLLAQYRQLGLPLFHVTTIYRDRAEIVSNPYWRFQADRTDSSRAKIAEHNLDHLPGIELMPGIREGAEPIIVKKRYDSFHNTDLDLTLRAHGIDSLLLLGVNTSSCVIATTFAASIRDYAVFVVEDGVDTMLGPKLHAAANLVIDESFGWVVDGQTTLDVLGTTRAQS